MDLVSKKVFITSIDSFTGKHLKSHLQNLGFDIYGSSQLGNEHYKCDITNKDEIISVLKEVSPDYIINLSGIAFVGHGNNNDFYAVNTVGAINILDAVLELKQNPKKIILASSAVLYGAQSVDILDETLTPNPVNHYGMSKYAMELLAKNYFDKLNIIITRPFNYTGVGQSENFVIPKIVSHFKRKEKKIELGNINVYREYNDVAYICEAYAKLLTSNTKGEIVNLCSNKAIALQEVILAMNAIAGYEICVEINQAFVRANEIPKLSGSTDKLETIVGKMPHWHINDTLKRMYESQNTN